MNVHVIKAPGKPRRLHSYPLYEVNLTKDGIVFCEDVSYRGSPVFAVKEGISKLDQVFSATHNPFDQSPVQYLGSPNAASNRQEDAEKCFPRRSSQTTSPKAATSSPPFPISPTEFKAILQALPPRFHFYQWSVVFDTTRHGCSLHHFYRMMNHIYYSEAGAIGLFLVRKRTDDPKGSLNADFSSTSTGPLHYGASSAFDLKRVVKNDNNEPSADRSSQDQIGIVGCFTPTVPCEQLIGVPHAGSPETFVFSLESEATGRPGSVSTSVASMWNSIRGTQEVRFHSSPTNSVLPEVKDRRLRVYRWGKEASVYNRFMRCQRDGMSFGGGEHGPALWVDEQIEKGTSSRFCQTFRSPPLFGAVSHALSHSEFQIERMVWLAMNMRHALHVASGSGEMPESLLRNEKSVWSAFMDDPSRLQQQIVHE